ANLVYLENPSDSTVQKLEGALLNALVFAFSLPLLLSFLSFFTTTFINFLKNYMRFSDCFILGSIFLSIVQHYSIPVDSITCFVLLFNFTVLGVITVSSPGVPIFVRQVYMVCFGIIAAFWFTSLPEWTTWAFLLALALYDLVAVLAPGSSRNNVEVESRGSSEYAAIAGRAERLLERHSSSSGSSDYLVDMQSDQGRQDDNADSEIAATEMSPLVEMRNESHRLGGHDWEMMENRGIQLGLGDFIFYSVLVGRATMYDLTTVYACYLAIISGLGCTLILLSVCHQALPALPISLILGVVFYFLTRLLMEPFVVGISTNLM
ncbi:Peptidase A22A, presenilin, partial [Dillenia turbinata]